MNEQQKAFVSWLVKKHPKIATQATRQIERDAVMGEVGDFWETFTSAVEKVAPVVVKADAERRVIKAQIEQARAGRPLLNPEQISPPVNVNVSPSFTIPEPVKWLGYGAAGVGGLLLLKKLVKG